MLGIYQFLTPWFCSGEGGWILSDAFSEYSFYSFLLLMWYAPLVDFCVLNYHCFSKIRLTLSLVPAISGHLFIGLVYTVLVEFLIMFLWTSWSFVFFICIFGFTVLRRYPLHCDCALCFFRILKSVLSSVYKIFRRVFEADRKALIMIIVCTCLLSNTRLPQ